MIFDFLICYLFDLIVFVDYAISSAMAVPEQNVLYLNNSITDK
jgi:hypothetical protein